MKRNPERLDVPRLERNVRWLTLAAWKADRAGKRSYAARIRRNRAWHIRHADTAVNHPKMLYRHK